MKKKLTKRRTPNHKILIRHKKQTHNSSIWNNWKTRHISYPLRKYLTLDELDKIPYVDEKGRKIDIRNEREEQYVCHEFIEPTNTVLELGARYGLVSCVINHKLECPTHHVCLEPDKTVIASLKKKQTHTPSSF